MSRDSERVVLLLCRLILATCTILVIWQGWQSLAKYLDKPQSTAISTERLEDQEVRPVLSICPKIYTYAYNNESEVALKDCGITPDEYIDEGIWSSKICPDPKLLREKLAIPLKDMVEYVKVSYTNGSMRELAFDEMTRVPNFDWDYGQCYTMAMLEPTAIKIRIKVFQEVAMFIHTHGLLFDKDVNEPVNLETGKYVYHKIDLEAVHALDFFGQKCYEHNRGNYDFCMANGMDQFVIDKVGCATPFGVNADNICSNMTLSAMALKIYDDLEYGVIHCQHPCSYLQAKSRLYAIDKFYKSKKGKAKLTFSQKVRMFRSHYSFTGFSLVAEVGGYVGLFLGANFLQFSDLLRLLVRRYL